jgi:dTDP-4-dehydrorhamnose 3,5-epimerase
MNLKKDVATTTSEGVSLAKLPDGVTFKEIPTHIDERGSVFELYDLRWDWHPEPLVFSYAYTVRPRVVKGWSLHKEHEDRYFIMSGELEVVFFDARPESSTYQQISKVVLSEFNRRIMNIPRYVWHAVHNIGLKDAMVVNFPTIPYDHDDPDKYRLPLDTDQIPYRFENVRGW